MKAGKLVLSAIVTLNLAAMVWRLDVRRHLHASMSAVEVLRAGLALTLVSATLLALIWTRWGKIASACLTGVLRISARHRVWEHFLAAGADNVFALASGPWAVWFETSASALVVLEIAGLRICARALFAAP